jgi:hypothetical protein
MRLIVMEGLYSSANNLKVENPTEYQGTQLHSYRHAIINSPARAFLLSGYSSLLQLTFYFEGLIEVEIA